MGEKRYFSTREAAQLADLSEGMIDYLCRHKIVVPGGTPTGKRGRNRRFKFGDVVVLRAIARLLDQGVEVKRLRTSLRKIADQCSGMGGDPYVMRYLITDGVDVYLKSGAEILARATDGQLAFAFVIDIHRLQDDVRSGHRTPAEERRRRARGLPPIKRRA